MSAFAAILFLSGIVEGLVEYFLTPLPDLKPYLKYVAAVVGIIVALVFNLDIFTLIGIHAAYPIASVVLTGVLIGRGSNYISDLLGSFTDSNQPAAPSK